jgi:DNA-binding NarL/FixJ family response regulator
LTPSAIADELVAKGAAGRLDARAVEAVLAALGLPSRADPMHPSGLTRREVEVSKLLAQGRSNKDIGIALQISPRTVAVHVASIFDKLGVRNRATAAIRLLEHELAS